MPSTAKKKRHHITESLDTIMLRKSLLVLNVPTGSDART
jgi:hypothetical protein